MEVYVDDMLVRSQTSNTHLVDLAETFTTLKKFWIWLNLAKCAFKVSFEKFQGFMVSRTKMSVNLEKV